MSNKIYTSNCNERDILTFDDEACKLSKFKQQLWKYFYNTSTNFVDKFRELLGDQYNLTIEKLSINRDEDWFYTGKDCQILKPGKQWQKGKLRIKLTLEFIPDEPIEDNDDQEIENIIKSPLDEIRQQLTDESNS